MHVSRRTDVTSYNAPKHHGMTAFRLQGLDATPAETMWVGLSIFAPGGGAEEGSAPSEKVYVVLEGEITVVTAQGEAVLGVEDSILIEANEIRTVENRSNAAAKMLVISPRG